MVSGLRTSWIHEADAVATALYVMGEEEGLAWVKQRPELEAMFVLREGDGFRTVRSPGFPAAR